MGFTVVKRGMLMRDTVQFLEPLRGQVRHIAAKKDPLVRTGSSTVYRGVIDVPDQQSR